MVPLLLPPPGRGLRHRRVNGWSSTSIPSIGFSSGRVAGSGAVGVGVGCSGGGYGWGRGRARARGRRMDGRRSLRQYNAHRADEDIDLEAGFAVGG